MKATLSVTAHFEMEIDDKYRSLVDDFNSVLADELVELVSEKTKGQTINFQEVCLMGIMDEDGNPLCEWAECDETELKVG